MNDGQFDGIWKALSDPTRRTILDVLKEEPRTTGDLCERFPKLSRCMVMKHLGVLEKAGLLSVKRKGKFRWNYLNATPIQWIYERWMNRYTAPHAASLLHLQQHIEQSQSE